jgi:hypothetical protein
MNWKYAAMGTKESTRVGVFEVSVFEPLRAKDRPAQYQFHVGGYTSARYDSREAAKAAALDWLYKACNGAIAVLDKANQ